MGFFSNLFGSKKPADDQKTKPAPSAAAEEILQAQKLSFQQQAALKERTEPIPEAELMQTFAQYFVPNTDLFAVPGSEKFKAYFGAVNAARDEMIHNPQLFTAATKWEPGQLAELVNNPKPGVTNMLICGLIFAMGSYAVIKDAVYCVDFCEKIPNCIALYLLLIARAMPEDQRKMLIDAGDRSNPAAFVKALNALKVCEPTWSFLLP